MVAVSHLLWKEGCSIAYMKALEAAELHNCRLSSHMPHQSTRVNWCKLTFFTFVCFSPMCKQRVASLLSSGWCWSTSTVLARPLPPQGTQPIFLGRRTRTANIFSWEPRDGCSQFSEISCVPDIPDIGNIGDTRYPEAAMPIFLATGNPDTATANCCRHHMDHFGKWQFCSLTPERNNDLGKFYWSTVSKK